ncbi:MAG: hypothetical protein FWF78_02830 [Defluviitaleaceae bacterium]|nr:hypothetical protein [Defluviitaleaceae bacterium]
MMMALRLQNNRNVSNQQAQLGVGAPDPSKWGRNHVGDGRLLSTGLSEEHIEWRTNFQNPSFRANHWINGIEGREGFEKPLGVQVFTQLLRENGIELPENANFNIGVDRYGGVTITGLNNAELKRVIEEAMSYDSRMVISVLAQFMEYGRILEGHPPSSTHVGLSVEQQTLIAIQSELMNSGTDLRNLSLGANGRIQGLPQELYEIIYGDRTSHLKGLNRYQAEQENHRLNWLRDNIANFLRNGTAHMPAPNISLSFDSGRMTVNGVNDFNPNSGGGINITI